MNDNLAISCMHSLGIFFLDGLVTRPGESLNDATGSMKERIGSYIASISESSTCESESDEEVNNWTNSIEHPYEPSQNSTSMSHRYEKLTKHEQHLSTSEVTAQGEGDTNNSPSSGGFVVPYVAHRKTRRHIRRRRRKHIEQCLANKSSSSTEDELNQSKQDDADLNVLKGGLTQMVSLIFSRRCVLIQAYPFL